MATALLDTSTPKYLQRMAKEINRNASTHGAYMMGETENTPKRSKHFGGWNQHLPRPTVAPPASPNAPAVISTSVFAASNPRHLPESPPCVTPPPSNYLRTTPPYSTYSPSKPTPIPTPKTLSKPRNGTTAYTPSFYAAGF